MKKYLTIILLFTVLISQDDRSTLFSTGTPPELGVGWDIKCTSFTENELVGDINNDGGLDVMDIVSIVGFIIGDLEPTEEEAISADANADGEMDVLDVVLMVNVILNGDENYGLCESGLSAAIRFTSPYEYTFEAFSVMFQTGDLEGEGLFEVRLHSNSNNLPGEVLGEWDLTLSANTAREYYVFTADTDCIVLYPMTIYWISVHPVNNQDEAIWLFSEDDYTYSTSENMGSTWSDFESGQVGCTKIFAEQIYDPSLPNPGLDTVYDWSLQDINENSDYFNQSIGPSTFIQQDFVSLYYFGKAG